MIKGAGRILIPKSMRKETLKELHAAHSGRERTLQRARQCVYWPGMTNDITNMIRTCDECEIHKASQQKEPMIQEKLPSRPGESIAADLFTHNGNEFLVITDKYSGWPMCVDVGKSASTKDVTNLMTFWASNMGVPNRITTDNGPQFKSEEFKTYCEDWGIIHELSSPYHHQSNGYAEAAVKSMKSIVIKLKRNQSFGENLLKAVLEYRNVPRKDGLSPAQRLFGRPMRTRMPSHPMIFKPIIQKKIRKADRKADLLRQQAKDRYDSSSKELKKLRIGDVVRVQHAVTKKWDLIGQVVGVHDRGRSYYVKTETGRLLRRNRRFLKLCRQDIVQEDTTTNINKEPRPRAKPSNGPNQIRKSNRQRRAPERMNL